EYGAPEPGRVCRRPPPVQAGLTDPGPMTYAPMLMVFAISALVAGALVLLPSLLAPRRLTPVKAEPFECGKDPIEVSEGRFAIKFSMIAIFFILIVIDLLFICSLAVLYRPLCLCV